VPIGLAELHETDDEVFLVNVTTDQLSTSPEYVAGVFSSSLEASVRNVFAGAGASAATGIPAEGTDYYSHEHYNEDNLYRRRNTPPVTDAPGETGTGSIPVVEENLNVDKRTVETGGARIRSKVSDLPVEEDINLKEEHVN